MLCSTNPVELNDVVIGDGKRIISAKKTLNLELRSFGYFPQSEQKPCRLVTLEDSQIEEGIEIMTTTEFLLNA
jgi:hypothetical protein